MTQPLLDDLASRLGPRQTTTVFIVEDPIEGIEVGYDGTSIDGHFPAVASFGYEVKDAGYVGKVVDDADLPAVLREVNDKLSPAMVAPDGWSFFSPKSGWAPTASPI